MWLWIIVGLVLLIGLLLWWNSRKGKEDEGGDMSANEQSSPEAPGVPESPSISETPPTPPIEESPMESAPSEEPESSMPEQSAGPEDVEEEERPM